MKYILTLFIILFTSEAFSQDKGALRIRNQRLTELYQLSQSTENHNALFMYQTNVGQSGYIANENIPFIRIPYGWKISMPAGLEIRDCKTPPLAERVVVKVQPGQDYIEIYVAESVPQKLLLSCSAQDLTNYTFISYKNP